MKVDFTTKADVPIGVGLSITFASTSLHVYIATANDTSSDGNAEQFNQSSPASKPVQSVQPLNHISLCLVGILEDTNPSQNATSANVISSSSKRSHCPKTLRSKAGTRVSRLSEFALRAQPTTIAALARRSENLHEYPAASSCNEHSSLTLFHELGSLSAADAHVNVPMGNRIATA